MLSPESASATSPHVIPTAQRGDEGRPGPFAGKRRLRRFPNRIQVDLEAPGFVLSGRTVDISPEGFRAELAEASALTLCADRDAVHVFHTLETHFGSGVRVTFPRQGLHVPSAVVRVTTPPRPGGSVQIACVFSSPLAPRDWAKLLLR